MDQRGELADFLRSRRARVRPVAHSVSPTSGRRVPGLRREEVATIAGISVEYYARLERGRQVAVSDGVLAAVARALQLDSVETAHLFDLAHAAARPIPARRGAERERARPVLQRILDALDPYPAVVTNELMDLVAGNLAAMCLYSELISDPYSSRNHARFTFISPHAREFYAEWELVADEAVAALRRYVTRNPSDHELSALIDELKSCSEEFRTRWDAHDVLHDRRGQAIYDHPLVGRLTFEYERLDLPSEPGLGLLVHTFERGSATEQRLARLRRSTVEDHIENANPPMPVNHSSIGS